MIVEMCMSKNVETVQPDTFLLEAVRRMTSRHIRRLVVLDGESIVGIICHHDIVRALPANINPFSAIALDQNQPSGRVHSCMTQPVITIDAGQPIEAAAQMMTQHHIGGMPVLQNHRLAGIVTESDIFRTFSKLLSGQSGSTRITFDVTANENALPFLVSTTNALRLELVSVFSYFEGARRLAVARVQGGSADPLVEKLWESNHPVVNVLTTLRPSIRS